MLWPKGREWFYRGPFAVAVDQWMTTHGGALRFEDFRDYRAKRREPVPDDLSAGMTSLASHPPALGGVHVGQILNILERFDLSAMGHNSAEFVHVVAEAMKLAFADRAHWLGDPDYVDVPRGLVSRSYAEQLADKIRPGATAPVPSHGQPEDATTNVFGKHTTHFSVADGDGNLGRDHGDDQHDLRLESRGAWIRCVSQQ